MTAEQPSNDSISLEDLQWAGLLDANAQLNTMRDAWWRVNAGLRLLRGQDADEIHPLGEVIDDLKALEKKLGHVERAVQYMVRKTGQKRDAAALQDMTPSDEYDCAVRERLAQIDLNLSGLYQEMQAMCRQSAAPLVQEAQADAASNHSPLWDAEVHADLDYMIDEPHPLYDKESNNILAKQEAIHWTVNATGLKDHIRPDNTEQDNWLDCLHPWMNRQGWLTHDLLEHHYGQSPYFGVATLLQTQTIWVEVHTVRSYAYDLKAGKFVTPNCAE